MNKALLIILFTACCTEMNAQPWFPVNRNGVNYYEGNGKGIAGYIIDSTVTGETKKYTFNRTIELANLNDCHATANSGWLGKEMDNVGDTLYVFRNKFLQPINLKVNTQLGDSFIAFSNTTITTILILIKDTFQLVLGEADSVKQFKIVMLNKNNQYLTDNIFHNAVLSISKHHGMVNTINFYTFPAYEIRIQGAYMRVLLSLSGNSKAASGLKNIKSADVYNFDVGDEFHHLKFMYSLSLGMGATFKTDTSKIILTVIDKQVNNDTVKYTFKKRSADQYIINSTDSFAIINDTTSLIYYFGSASFLDKEPGDIDSTYQYATSYLENEKELSCKRHFSYSLNKHFQNDTCLMVIPDGSSPLTTYYKGAGAFSESYSDMFGLYAGGLRLIYYKKGTQTWGTPWPANVGVEEKGINTLNVSVYPNPASAVLQFKTNETGKLQLCLYSIDGKLLIHQLIKNNEKLNIEVLKPGLYFYHLQAGEKTTSGKLIKE